MQQLHCLLSESVYCIKGIPIKDKIKRGKTSNYEEKRAAACLKAHFLLLLEFLKNLI